MTIGETLGQRALRVLHEACSEFDFGRAESVVSELLQLSASSWFDRPTNERFPAFLLEGGPFQLCFHLPPHDVRQFRFTVEPIGEEPTLFSYWNSATSTLERICKRMNWSFDTMGKLYELTRPAQNFLLERKPRPQLGDGSPSHGRWASWIGGAVSPQGDVTVKTYICLRHAQERSANIDEILAAAGVGPKLQEALPTDIKKRIAMMTVDLCSEGVKRVKVYLKLSPTGPNTADELDRIGALTPQYRAGDARRFLELYAPEGLEALPNSPFLTCTLHAVDNRWDRLTTNAIHYSKALQPPEAVLVSRARAAIREYGAQEEAYDRFARVVGYSNIRVMSLQRQAGVPMLTLYANIPLFDENAKAE